MSRAAVTRISFALTLLVPLLAPKAVHAGGLEYTAAGATALGRGGAVAARADDPMVLYYNPAGLVELRGNQLLIDANIALMDACVDPIGFYGWGAYNGGAPSRFVDTKTGARREYALGMPSADPAVTKDQDSYYFDPLDTVCLDQHVIPVPQLIYTSRLSEDFGIGAGFVYPAISPTGKWGGKNGIIRGDDGDLRPAPTRYMQLSTGNFGVFPTVGAAYRVMPWLRVGAAFEWGMIWVNTTTMGGIGTGTSPSNDVIANVRARDMFIPALNASVHVVPMDSLDVVAAFRWQDDIKATDGELDLTTGVFDQNGLPYKNTHLSIPSVEQKMPWKLRLGARYADRLVPRPAGTGGRPEGGLQEPVRDYFTDERWDVELDVEYQMNSRNQAQKVTYGTADVVYFQPVDGSAKTTAQFPSVPFTEVQKHWKDQISVRAGGSYNIFPGVFGVMGGAHYENRGIDPSYMQIDFWPVSRVGLHAGVTFRVAHTTDIVLSYAHIFQETIVVAPPPHDLAATIYADTPEGVAPSRIDKGTGIQGREALPPTDVKNPPSNPDATAKLAQTTTRFPNGQPLWIVNSGTYRSSMNVLAIGVHAHF
jgi:hypothetical protein